MIHLTVNHCTAREIIQNTFSPLVGVITSPLADDISRRNNVTFVELLQPFAKLITDAHFHDASGTSVSTRGLRINFCDIDWRPPQTVLARKILNEAVSKAYCDKSNIVTTGAASIEVPLNEPWFDHWRETFLTVQFPADHEFIRHFLSCLIVLSSNDCNIVDTAHKLTQRVHQMQSVTPQKLPKWFHPSDVLNSYVVLHESNHSDLSRAQQSFELLKSTFGDSKCFLIQLNSLDETVVSDIPDYWAPYIQWQCNPNSLVENLCGSKTSADLVSVIPMPAMQMSNLIETQISNDTDMPILHPLSPVQERGTEAINSKFSTSSDSLVSQTLNSNVWTRELVSDEPRGVCLNAIDVENLRHFVQDYAVRALIPYIEHLVVTLTEALTNKKGVSKSLLSATKRWFVTSKPGAGASSQNGVIYTHESIELQTRKLADLYFMFGHYNLAFQAYHQAKRDFNADSAWQYYAGSLEMAAISSFMLGTANRKTYDYMEDAIVCYLTVCKLQQFATRATLLSMECLKAARLYTEAAKQLIRMTSEESDLRSALLLEQAAYCFLATEPPMFRKYAFHIVLSGNRYSRAGQRNHAYRCYRQAHQVFSQHGWSLAEDHIQYTMAKQAYVLKKLEESSRSYTYVLRPGSLQTAQQQTNFLKEYIQTQNELVKRQSEFMLFSHALPQLVPDSIRILVSAAPPVPNPNNVPANNINIESNLLDECIWHKIEEMITSTVSGYKPFVFKASCSLFTKENISTDCPLAVQDELIQVAVTLSNSLRCSITLTDIDILWQLTLANAEVITNSCLYEKQFNETLNIDKTAICSAINVTCSQSIILEDCTKKPLYFKITPKLPGRLDIIGMVCKVSLTAESNFSLQGLLHFELPRAKNNAKQSVQSSFNSKLSINIIPPVPALDVSFTAVPTDLLTGEIVPITISLRNTGMTSIEDIFLGCEDPRWITIDSNKYAKPPITHQNALQIMAKEKLSKDKEICRQHVFRLLQPKKGIALQAQGSTTVPMWLQAPYQKGECTMRLLFYYTLPESSSTSVKYRLVRQSWCFNVHECLRTEVALVNRNITCNELGLDVSVMNDNGVHNTLNAELYINSLALYSLQYRLNMGNPHFINQTEITVGQLGDCCLKRSKSASFQCRLEKVDSQAEANASTEQLVKMFLSSVNIMPTNNASDSQVPKLNEIHSFLVKHETIFFKPSISSEDFNSGLNNAEQHSTVVLIWSSVISQNSLQRVAFGQSFVQLNRLYDVGTCPREVQPLLVEYKSSEPTTQLIYNFPTKYSHIVEENASTMELHVKNIWEYNENVEETRCLLEDESLILAVKM